MIYTIYPNIDATIYEKTESLNTGIDSILELSHERTTSSSFAYNSRILMKFDMKNITDKISAGKIPSSSNYYLSLRISEIKEIPQEYTVYIHPLSGSWTNGTGHYTSRPSITDGVSWKYKSSKNIGLQWNPSQSLSVDSTGSYSAKNGGGIWWSDTALMCSQSFYYESSDMYTNVTPIINKWISGSIQNDGLIIKFSEELEQIATYLPNLKFFSTDSNTIYVPRLHVVWDDSRFLTGSLKSVILDNMVLNVKLKKYYSSEEKAKIRIYGNTRYPEKNYTTQSYQTTNYYLPSSSYYEVRDAHTDEVILPFNYTGSKISCDATSSYFNLWMNSFQPERFYRILVKMETDDGDNVQIFDNNYYFKVTR